MRRVASAISQQRLFQENLEVWKITPVVVERDFSLIDGYGVIAGCYGKIVTLRYTHPPHQKTRLISFILAQSQPTTRHTGASVFFQVSIHTCPQQPSIINHSFINHSIIPSIVQISSHPSGLIHSLIVIWSSQELTKHSPKCAQLTNSPISQPSDHQSIKSAMTLVI